MGEPYPKNVGVEPVPLTSSYSFTNFCARFTLMKTFMDLL